MYNQQGFLVVGRLNKRYVLSTTTNDKRIILGRIADKTVTFRKPTSY